MNRSKSQESGSSLLVPSVQELSKESVCNVPQRYFQPQHQQQTLLISHESDATLQIPVIDIQKLLSQESGSSELIRLHLACKEWGFFQIINHGVSSSLVDEIKLEIREFFNLPISEKKKFWQSSETMEGFGQLFVVSEDQKLDWHDMFYMITLPTKSRMPHLFPQLYLPFRDTLELYSQKMKDLAMIIIGQMGKALEIEEREMRELFEDGIQMMRMNYYPPFPQPEKVIGFTNHSDASALTILLQVNQVEGLQIRKDGMWIPVKPLPNAFVVNVGDIMERLLSQESATSELDKLHLACKEWGFFQLINHGIRSSLVEKVKLEMEDFFNLPMTEKKKFWQTPEHMEGFGQAFVLSEDQKLDWGDIFYMIALPKHSRMPHLFSQLPLPFRDTLEVYSEKMKDVAMDILGHLAKALGIEEVEIRELFENGIQMMRMNYYPPCPEPEKVNGLTNHSDPSALTILLQLNEQHGLQIRKDGMWVPVKPLPNAFIVNVGDILEIITNGTYRSVEHRATVNCEKERLSFATFYSPREDAVIGPSPPLITDQTPPQFKSIRVHQYFKDFFARKLEGKSNRDNMKIEHPN